MVELSLLHKEIHRFNEITGLFFFFKNHKLILIFMQKGKKAQNMKSILKKNKVGGLILLDFKTYHTATNQDSV